jgi:ATP synthase protein I
MLSTIIDFALRLPRNVRIASNPIRVVLRWQLYITVALALVGFGWAGTHGAVSALLGGLIIITAGSVYAIMISGRSAKSARETLRTLVRAEASKIALIVLQLWLVLTTYHDVVLIFFFAAFFVAVLIFSMALLVRE